MFYVLQNESVAARRRVPILLTDAATGTTAQTGVSLASIYPYVNINGGAFIGGTGNVGEAGFGQYYYEMEVNETATLGLAGIHITASGCRDYDAIAQVALFNVYSSGGVGISAGDVWSYVLSDTNTAEADLITAASGGAGMTAYDVWSFDYINAPGGVIPNSAAERLEDARTYSFNAEGNTQNIASNIWNRDPVSSGDNLTGDYFGAYLYQLGIGATGMPSGGGGGVTAGDVWSYVDRTITGGIADTVQLVSTPVDVSTASMSGIANTVWDFVITGFGQTGSAALYSTQTLFTAGNIETYVANQTPQDVWTYSGIEGRTITGGIADTVTTLTNKAGFAITGGTIDVVNDKTGYSLSGTQSFNLTGNITGNLSGSVGSVAGNVSGNVVGSVASVTNPVSITTANMASIASSTWNSLTASYSTHGTFGLNILRADQANKIGEVTLYSSGGVNGVDADVHRIANDTAAATSLKNILTGISGETLTANVTGNVSGSVNSVTQPVSLSTATQASIANSVWLTDVTSYVAPSAGEDLATAAVGGISPADVWTYATRTITGGLADTVTTLTNKSGFAITGGTITTVSDKTGYSLSGTQAFDLTGNITGSLSGSVGSVSGSVGSVSGAVGSVTGNVGGNVVGSVASVSNPVSITTASMGSIGSTVWNYVLSDAQTADANLVAAGSGGVAITAGDVWSYNTRTLTSGAGITVIGAVQLVNGPYRLTSNQNNNDGILDILQNSVQEINLNLIDGNGAPASTAGYGVAVNFFDEAGTAVTSYTPTVEYADGGILSFEIDTAVTATTGRYNLIVNLSGAGFLVKYGPLTTLVRPL